MSETENRRRKDVPESVIITALARWREHREWGPTQASQELGIPKSTLATWRDKYSSKDLAKEPVPMRAANRLRATGAGRKAKNPGLTDAVVKYYKDSLQRGPTTNKDVIAHCRAKKWFPDKSDGALEVWISRLLKRIKDSTTPEQATNERAAPDTATRFDAFRPHRAAESDAVETTQDVQRDRGDGSEETNREDQGESEEEGCAEDQETRTAASGGDTDVGGAHMVPSIPPERRYSLRSRANVVKFRFSYANQECSRGPATIAIEFRERDLFSVERFQRPTAAVVDFAVHTYIPHTEGHILAFGSSLFLDIERVDKTDKSFDGTKYLVDKVDWDKCPYALIPVSAGAHWSLLVVEGTTSDQGIKFYHVDSVAGKHQSPYVFDTAQLFFQAVSGKDVSVVGEAVAMKPPQKNGYDCAFYMLWAMVRIAGYVQAVQPDTLAEEISALTAGCSEEECLEMRTDMKKEFDRLSRASYSTGAS